MVRCGGFCCCYCCSCRRLRGGYCFGSPPPPPPPTTPPHHHHHPSRTHLGAGGRWSNRLSGLLHALHASPHAHTHAPSTPPVTYCAAASQEPPCPPITRSPPPRASAPASHEPALPPAPAAVPAYPAKGVRQPQAPGEAGGAALQQQQQQQLAAGRAYQGLGRRLRRALLRWGEDQQQQVQQEAETASSSASVVAVVEAEGSAGQQASASLVQRGVEGGGAAGVVASRRGSAGSVVSEGGAGRGVVASTLTRWRRLQGSVGSLTATFRQRASQRLTPVPRPHPAAAAAAVPLTTAALSTPPGSESPPPPAAPAEDVSAPSGGASPVCTSPSTSSGTTSSDEAGDSSTGTVIFRPPTGHGAAGDASPTLASSPTPPASPEGHRQPPQTEGPAMAALAGREGPRRRASDALLALDGEPQPKRPTLAAGEAGLSPPASPSPALPTSPPPSLTASSPHTSPTQSPLPLSRRRFYESMMGDEEPPAPPAPPEPLTDSVSLSSDGDSGIVHEEVARHGDADDVMVVGGGGAAEGRGGPRHTDNSDSESEGGKRGTSESGREASGEERDSSVGERDSESKVDTSESERDVSEGRGEVDDTLGRTPTGGQGEAATAAPPPTGEEEEDPGGGKKEELKQYIIERVSQGQAAGNEVSIQDNLRGDSTTTTTTTTTTTITTHITPTTLAPGSVEADLKAAEETEDTADTAGIASLVGTVGMAPRTPQTLPPQPQLQPPPPQPPTTPTSNLLHPSISSEPQEEEEEEEEVVQKDEEEEEEEQERVMYSSVNKHEEDVASSTQTTESGERDATSEDRMDTSVTSESSERSEPKLQWPQCPTPAEHPMVGIKGVTTEACDSDGDSERDSLIVSRNDSDQDLDAEEEEVDRLPIENDPESNLIPSDVESSNVGISPVQPCQAREEGEDTREKDRTLPQTDKMPERNARGSFDRRVCSDTQEEEESVVVTLSSAGPRILITVAGGEGEGATVTPNHFQESGSATSGWGGCSLEGVAFTSTHLDSSHTAGPHLTHPRAPTPKSPITVDEWVAALPPNPTSVEEEGDAWGGAEGDDPGEDSLNLGAEAGLMCGSVVTSSSASAPASVTHTLHTTTAATSRPEVRRSSQPENMLSAAAAMKPMPGRQRSLSLLHTRGTDASGAVSTRPLTLSDVANIQQQQQQMERMGVEGRRLQFAGLRDKQSSFQSELSGLSLHSRSSIDSLLDSRQADPVEVLLSLGFGGQPQDSLSRIPERFLKPSRVPGNSIDDFLKSEEEITEMMETAEMMPGIDPQGLTIMRGGLSPRGRQYYRHRRRHLRAQSPHTSVYSAPPAIHHWHRNRFLSVQRE